MTNFLQPTLVTADRIVDSSIATADIADSAITSAKIATDAVTQAKIADSAVGAAEIASNAVTQVKIADGAVGTAELIDANVTMAKLADASVGTAKIVDSNVTTAKLADGAVTSSKIADGAVGTADIGDGIITNAKLATDVKIGSLAALTTVAKSSIQAAINELVTSVSTVMSSVAGLLGGASVSNARLIEWTQTSAYQRITTTYNTTLPHAAATATVLWPDGSAGIYTTLATDTATQAVNSFKVTHAASGKTITQPLVTRNSVGGITMKPALTIS